jgi:DNA-binding LacI/PurR family transcriptional regulator
MPQNAPKSSFVPIYQQLIEHYREEILSFRLKPGERIDSINTIMRIHHVSRETAKTVLNALSKEGYIVQKPGKGSFVADLRPKKKIWAVILPFYSVQYEQLLMHLREQAWRMGRELNHFVDHNNWHEEIRLVGQCINEQYEAIVVIPTLDESETAPFYRSLPARQTCVTLVDHTMAGSFFRYAIQSYDLGVQRGMRYLIENTGKAIAFVRNETWAGRNMVAELMEETYSSLIALHRPAQKPVIIDHVSRVGAEFLKARDIGGLFCCDDSDAIRIIGRLKAEGKSAGEDFRLVSYGNTDLARYFTPAITSIDPKNDEMARQTTAILERTIAGEDTAYCQFVIQPELIVRQT